MGAISIGLIDADLRPYSSFAFIAELQDALRQHPLAETVSFRGSRSGPGGDALDIELYEYVLELFEEQKERIDSYKSSIAMSRE